MRCFCNTAKCRKFIGGTQETTADIAALGDAEDVTYDPEPVLVKVEETDGLVQAMLDKEVGTTQRNWDTKMLSRCVCVSVFWRGRGPGGSRCQECLCGDAAVVV
jgi:hypothetical protein